MTDSMVERVARALRECDPSAGAPYEVAARAAIEAMREPTEPMIMAAIEAEREHFAVPNGAAFRHTPYMLLAKHHRAMMDKALT